MNLRQLEYVVELSKTRNYLRASENLYITQPTLSKQIKALEEELGVVLFIRNSKEVKPTKACEVFVSYAKKINNESYNLLNEMKKYSHSKKNINVSVFFGLNFFGFLDPLKKYIDEHQELHFSLSTDGSVIIRKNLLNHKIDLGITLFDESEDVQDIKCIKRIAKVFPVIAMPINHPLSKYKEIDISMLKNYSIVMMTEESILYKDINPEVQKECDIACNCSSFDTACELVRGKVGLSIVGLSENRINDEYNGVVFRKYKKQEEHEYSLACIVNSDNNNPNIIKLVNDVYSI